MLLRKAKNIVPKDLEDITYADKMRFKRYPIPGKIYGHWICLTRENGTIAKTMVSAY